MYDLTQRQGLFGAGGGDSIAPLKDPSKNPFFRFGHTPFMTPDSAMVPEQRGVWGQPQNAGGVPQAPQAPAANSPFMAGGLPQMTPLQGMGLQSPFMTERPAQALPTQGFMPSRTNAMGPNAMSMMGMNPNMGNMVGPTSALPASMQPQASQLRMYGMEDQLANPPGQQQPGGPGQQQPGIATNPAPGYLQPNPFLAFEGNPTNGPRLNPATLAMYGISSPYVSQRDLQNFEYMSDWAAGG